MTFQQHAVWDLRFLEEDCQTVVGRRFDVPDDRELFELAERGGADVTPRSGRALLAGTRDRLG